MATIKINKENLFHNLEVISKKANGKDKVAVVLKDNAYGHGLAQIASLASSFGIKKAVVEKLNEAQIIKKYFDEILVLAETDFSTYSQPFHITLNSLEQLEQMPKNANVHIKVDTGMHRNGLNKSELKEAIYGLYKRNLKFTGLFTHYKNSDELATDFYWQRANFREIKEHVKNICEQLCIEYPKFHSANSSALFRIKNFDEDMTRVGLATYGYLDSDTSFNNPVLKPVLSLWADKISSRILKKSQRVGYGGSFEAPCDMEVSTYNLGYGDGFFRLDGTKEFKTPKNYTVLGKVSMDNLTLNSTDDEVCIFNDVRKLAKIHNTISYEILTNLKSSIKKEIV